MSALKLLLSFLIGTYEGDICNTVGLGLVRFLTLISGKKQEKLGGPAAAATVHWTLATGEPDLQKDQEQSSRNIQNDM